ncbi:MAG: hypothetical protein D3923_10895 [Candidatus Electrothrix sp. AR3]|nr:hypothetical protein [Candidatus Electrothrix sp. AR3]
MFELEKSSLFFEEMAKDYPELVQNLEIVHENKKVLDESYHIPKHFILSLNNTLRSLLFFVENSIKNSPDWLRSCVKSYRKEYQREHDILKRLRDVSTHQHLIFPAESIIAGLYRIKSSDEYISKIGMGNLEGPSNYPWDLAMKNTDEIFHDLLVYHRKNFMDLEHSSLSECLGITRKWFFHFKFSNKYASYDEVIDVYKMLCNFSARLLDAVCLAYAEKNAINFDMTFYDHMKKFNCVNTMLEVDLYPSLFYEWWGGEVLPLNYGIRVKKYAGNSIGAYDEIHYDCYKGICDSPESYKNLLMKYRDLSVDEYFSEDNLEEAHSFIYYNHWHYKKSFGDSLMDTINAPEIMQLQRLGKIFLDEYEKNKLCTISSAGKNFKGHLDQLVKKI